MTRIRWLAVLPVVVVSGCDLFDQGKDVFEGLTNPLVTQGIVLDVAEAPSGVDLSGSGFVAGTTATFFLADAADATQLAEAPVRGAQVTLSLPGVGDVVVPESAAGTHHAGPGDALVYGEGATWYLDIAVGGGTSSALIGLPPAPIFNLPAATPAGVALSIDLSGQAFDGALVLVLGPGGVAYVSRPDGIEALYDFSRDASLIATVEVPGAAFDEAGSYVVGIAGMANTRADDFSNMNTLLSNVTAGRMHFEIVRVE
jgi:hypothetical protein